MSINKLFEKFFPTKPKTETEDTSYDRYSDHRVYNEETDLPAYLRRKHTNPDTGSLDIESARAEYAASCLAIANLN